jgi:hypothetical protein
MTHDIPALKKEAKSSKTTSERLLELGEISPELARSVAKSKYAPIQVLEKLAQHIDAHTRAAVARHRDTPMSVLERLAKDPQWSVCKATLERTPESYRRNPTRNIFEALAGNKRFSVRQTAAARVDCPSDLLEKLAKDPAAEVRRAVAENSTTPAYVLAGLVTDPDQQVRLWVARHRNADDATLDQLALDDDAWVRAESINDFGSRQKRIIPIARLTQLSQDPDSEVLKDVIRNDHSPTELVEQILEQNPSLLNIDHRNTIREWILGRDIFGGLSGSFLEYMLSNHPDLSLQLLERLSKVPNKEVLRRVVWHPRVTPEILHAMLAPELFPETPSIDQKGTLSVSELENISHYQRRMRRFFLIDLTAHKFLFPETQTQILFELESLFTKLDSNELDWSLKELLNSPHAVICDFAAERLPTPQEEQ